MHIVRVLHEAKTALLKKFINDTRYGVLDELRLDRYFLSFKMATGDMVQIFLFKTLLPFELAETKFKTMLLRR